MPSTAKSHFDQDIQRARAIRDLAVLLSNEPEETVIDKKGQKRLLIEDLLRSAWMFAVGAMDAYFCDAYIYVLTGTLRAKSLQYTVTLPPFIRKIAIPIGAILNNYPARPNWRWRMAIRAMMEKDNILELEKVRKLFNPFLEEKTKKKLFAEVVGSWIGMRGATSRMFSITADQYKALNPGRDTDTADKAAWECMNKRITKLIQRRHDCIHNCDRPKNKPQPIKRPGTVSAVINDIVFLVENFDKHIDKEFGVFLDIIGCNATTKNSLGY